MIIHIHYPIGNGKITIEKNTLIEKKTVVIDFINDIYNPNVLKLMSKYEFDKGKVGTKQYNIKPEQMKILFNNELIKINQEELNKKLENYKDKHIIITGSLRNMNINIDKGYVIKIDCEYEYKQNNINLLNCIKNNYKEIKEILNSDISPYKKHLIVCSTYNISESFLNPYNYWKIHMGYAEKKLNELKYISATFIEIINDIEKVINDIEKH